MGGHLNRPSGTVRPNHPSGTVPHAIELCMLRAFARRLMHQRPEVHLGVRRAKNRPVWGSRAGGAVRETR